MNWNIPLLDWQYNFLKSTADVKALSGASDTGKSWVCRHAIIDSCLRYPGSHHFVTSSTYLQAHRAIIEPMMNELNELGYGTRARYHKDEMYLQFRNGSRIECYGAEKLFYKIKSREFFSGFLEEATTIDDKYIEEFYGEANRRLRQKGFKGINKPLYIATNPDIKTRWLYENIFETPPPDTYVKQMNFYEGFHRHDKERERKIKMGSKRQRDLYLWGKWGVMEGQAFILEPGIHIKEFDDTQFEQFYITFDYGFYPDPQVYLLATVQNGTIFIIDEEVLYSVPINKHKPHFERWLSKNIVGYTGDTAPGGAEIRDLLNSLRITYYPTSKKRTVGWTTLADLIDLQRFVVHPRCKLTIRGLSSMLWTGSTIGVDCEGAYDDEADAVRYFFMCGLIFQKLGLRKTSSGKVLVDDVSTSKVERQRVGYVPITRDKNAKAGYR